jgi:hypothetical protein
MTLLRALAMPFQWTSLMLVALTASAAALALSVDVEIRIVAVVPLVFIASWLNKYAVALLDQASNGATDAPVATVEMLGPFGGARPLVHVVLGAAVLWLMSVTGPHWRPWIALASCLLFPASIAALAMHQRLLDAIAPRALWRTIRGLSLWYLLLLGALACCALAAYLLARSALWSPLRYALMELLLLCLYALIGGAIFARRVALEFEPRLSPEWAAERATLEHERQRQRTIDLIYAAVRVHDAPRAQAALLSWLAAPDDHRLAADLHVMLAQAAQWPEQRGLQTVARVAIGQLLHNRQLSIALDAATTTLVQAPDFALDTEADAVALARYALLCGRKGVALALLDNAARAAPGQPLGDDGEALRRELQASGAAQR